MKKSLVITIGVILILIVLGIWGYLLFFGTPSNSNDIFANLGFGNKVVEPSDTLATPPENTTTQIDVRKNPLQQLTTKPVAGFGFVGSSSDLIRYVERGTGHIFEINLTSGIEKQISLTTIPKVVEAVFSDSGTSVALITENNYTRDIVAGVIDEVANSVNFISLPEHSFEPAFILDTVLHFAVTAENGTTGYELDITTATPVKIFTILLRDVAIVWSADETHVYNRPTTLYKGSLYSVDSVLTTQTSGEYGFVGGVTDTHYLGSAIVDDTLDSYALDRISKERIPLPITYIPEKCIPTKLTASILWCASPFESPNESFIEDWYKGIVQSPDLLWLVDVELGEAELHSIFLEESGRLIDVDRISIDVFGLAPIFRNKVGNTLWIYDTRIK
ncbi:hypothetical protein N8083_01965 [Candidatus Pacebacteria bacterium]|nr:hypothetical protein [Candidatus Paceibacterota bacterium]